MDASIVQMEVESTIGLLAGGASASGASYFVGPDSFVQGSKFRGMAYFDQAGTIAIQQSRDGITWRTTYPATVVSANTATIIESLIVRPYVRVQVQNTSGVTLTISEVDSAIVVKS